jgi:hypothetical protein
MEKIDETAANPQNPTNPAPLTAQDQAAYGLEDPLQKWINRAQLNTQEKMQQRAVTHLASIANYFKEIGQQSSRSPDLASLQVSGTMITGIPEHMIVGSDTSLSSRGTRIPPASLSYLMGIGAVGKDDTGNYWINMKVAQQAKVRFDRVLWFRQMQQRQIEKVKGIPSAIGQLMTNKNVASHAAQTGFSGVGAGR